MSFQIGDVVAIRYKGAGRVVWHARLIVGADPGQEEGYAVITPDLEAIFEVISLNNAHVHSFVKTTGLHDKPREVGRTYFHDFTV